MRLSEENGEPIVRFLLERRTGGSLIGRFLNIPTTQLPEQKRQPDSNRESLLIQKWKREKHT